MTPFAEIPHDPSWPDTVRGNLASQSEEFFRHYFGGNLPSADEKRAFIEQSVRLLTPIRAFQNNLYRVEIADTSSAAPGFIHLVIQRLDGGTCNEWADLQRIKNEIAGPEYEAVELFPAESRLVNTGNEYHLWVLSKPGLRFAIGWTGRNVFAEPEKIREGPRRAAAALDSLAVQRRIPVGTFVLAPPVGKR